jgi:hypothetical protein
MYFVTVGHQNWCRTFVLLGPTAVLLLLHSRGKGCDVLYPPHLSSASIRIRPLGRPFSLLCICTYGCVCVCVCGCVLGPVLTGVDFHCLMQPRVDGEEGADATLSRRSRPTRRYCAVAARCRGQSIACYLCGVHCSSLLGQVCGCVCFCVCTVPCASPPAPLPPAPPYSFTTTTVDTSIDNQVAQMLVTISFVCRRSVHVVGTVLPES